MPVILRTHLVTAKKQWEQHRDGHDCQPGCDDRRILLNRMQWLSQNYGKNVE